MEDSLALLYAIGIYVCCFGLMFINYGAFASTIVRWSKEPVVKKGTMKIIQPPMSFKESVKCYIPGYQVCVVCETLYRRNLAILIAMCISMIGMAVNLINKFLLPINSYVMLVCSLIMVVALLVFHFIYAFVTANCSRVYGFGWLCTLLCFILPYVFCWYMRNNIPRKMRALHHERIFHEHSKDTVIRQKHSK